ncbi:class F sortase [Streptomyces beijiangensis]|uniref:Class F sortase n=1 Tax=Streptomyces beijiangensis TaxID=163361 RepID=A0A939FGQ4_9ACTN|nr:class F sortase [Streptomyces beijiangensis]MBO0517092.1 class F sortase [Streptomyces beijiangensis]
MTNPPAPAGPRLWPRVALVAVALFAGGRMIADSGAQAGEPPRPSAADAFDTSVAPGANPSVRSLPPSPPTRIKIKALDVDAPVRGLERDTDNTLEAPPPDDKNLAGWDSAGVTPGSTGTAVLAGHVDTHSGPAVFYGLGSLHKANKVSVTRADGRTAVFGVDAVEVYEKDTFPSEKVYRQAARAELRLITCGGNYTKKNGYSANTVVYAHLIQTL